MADLRELFRRAVDGFGERVRAVGDDQWENGTPCDDWDVRALVNHLVSEERWMVSLFDGSTIAEVGDRFEGDLLGDDPKAAREQAAGEARAVLDDPNALTRTVHLSFGDVAGDEYLRQLTLDHVIHAWDLARGIGGDERLDPDLVEFASDYLAGSADDWRAAGVFGARVEVPPGADAQTRLLAESGRRA